MEILTNGFGPFDHYHAPNPKFQRVLAMRDSAPDWAKAYMRHQDKLYLFERPDAEMWMSIYHKEQAEPLHAKKLHALENPGGVEFPYALEQNAQQ